MMNEVEERLPATARCIQCGYLLRGLPGNRCPECGHTFDPRNPGSYNLPGRRKPRPDNPAMIALVWACVAAGVMALYWWSRDNGIWVAAVLLLMAAFLKVLQAHRVSYRERWDAAKLRTAAALLLPWPMLLLQVGGCPCDHAKVVGSGPVGIAWSPSHGPCHNPPFASSGRHVHLGGHWWIAWLGYTHR